MFLIIVEEEKWKLALDLLPKKKNGINFNLD